MFGIQLYDHPMRYSSDELKNLLSTHGVIYWRDIPLDNFEQQSVMAKIGIVQGYSMQRAPKEFSDPKNRNIINLSNDDFLGQSRMGWHMDQTYTTIPYLPLRSLYCLDVSGINSTQFADIKILTDKVIERYPQLVNAVARYYIDSDKTNYNVRSMFSKCEHVKRYLFRYDNRMELEDGTDITEIKRFCRDLLDSDDIPKFSIEWRPFDFVIFDNNQCPHRRYVMNGFCKLTRVTSVFWLNDPKDALLMLTHGYKKG